jgi:integrase/recombinase XerD
MKTIIMDKLLIRFLMKENKRAKISNPEKTLLCRLTLNGVRAPYDFATDIKARKNDWCAKSQTIKGRQNKPLNDRLGFIKSQIQTLYSQMQHLGEVFTIHDLMNEYLGKNVKKITLLEMYDRFLEKLSYEKKSESTIARFKYEKKRLEKFLESIKGSAIEIHQISTAFCKQYHAYLLPIGTGEYASRKIETIKRLVILAIQQGYLKENPLAHYQEPRKRAVKIPQYLTEAEIWVIENTAFASEMLQTAADLFIFQCYTGFSYADLSDFDVSKHTLKEKNGTIWISKLRVKMEGRQESAELAELPLFPQAQKILDKYQGALPKLRNDHYNNYLKQIAEICNISKRLHTHLARKTAGDRWLNSGISLEVVAKMLGHQSPVTTSKHYAKVRRERINLEINSKWTK